jgi:hypothetical protein
MNFVKKSNRFFKNQMDFIKVNGFFKIKQGLQGSLERQDMQKTVLKRQGSLAKMTRPAEKCLEETGPGRLVSFDCALLVIKNLCNHVAWK